MKSKEVSVALVAWAMLFIGGLLFAQKLTVSSRPSPSHMVSFYRLRFELSTTSTGSKVTLENISNVLTARQVEVLNNPRKTRVHMKEFVVAPVNAGQLVGVTVDYAITPEAISEAFPCLLEKYPDGESTIRVYNVPASGEPLLLHEIVGYRGSDPLSFSVNLSPLQSVPALRVELPKLQLNKMLLAFYYPWYDMGSWNSPWLQDKPATLYSSEDPVAITRHIDQAKSVGIDAFISSWWGPGSYTDQNLATLLDIAQTKNFFVAIDFETVEFDPVTWEAIPRDEATLVSWLSYLINNYGDHPAFLKVDGKPVIVVWASGAVSLATWESVFAQVEAQAGPAIYIAHLSGGDPPLNDLDLFDGEHTYNILSIIQSNDEVPILAEAYRTIERGVHYYPILTDSRTPKIWAATIQPGYDDHLIPGRTAPILDRENGTLYRATFGAAVNSNPDWIFITSWNEWWEHTYIEPSVNFGDQYLQITREFAEKWKRPTRVNGQRDLPKAFMLYQNYPNPFNPSTTIRFSLPQREHVMLKVFNALGQEVKTLVNGEMEAGEHMAVFDANQLPGGIYFFRLSTEQFTPLDNSDLQTNGHRTAISNGVTQTRKGLVTK